MKRHPRGKSQILPGYTWILAAMVAIPLALPAQISAHSQTDAKLIPTPLMRAYIHAFRVYNMENDQAAAQEYKGESGAALRNALRVRLGLTEQQFAPFQNAAQDSMLLEESIRDRLSAIDQADSASHPAAKKLSAKAQADSQRLLAELRAKETEAVESIYQALDADAAQRLDNAVATLYATDRANSPLPKPAHLSSQSNSAALSLAATISLPGSVGAFNPNATNPGHGGGFCNQYTVEQEGELIQDCEDEGGTFNTEYCECDDVGGGGGGGGGGGESQPVITEISPSIVPINQDTRVTISGYNLGNSPTLNMPTGVTSSNMSVSEDQIIVTLTPGQNSTVGDGSLSVTVGSMSSNTKQLVLDGPYQIAVADDEWGLCDGCKKTIQRMVTYRVKNFSGTNSGAITVCESPTLDVSSWNCGGKVQVQARACASNPFDSFDGTFEDTWTLGTDNLPSGCGLDANAPWFWAYTSPVTPIGTPSGYIHTDAIMIDGVTTPNKIAIGTIMPK